MKTFSSSFNTATRTLVAAFLLFMTGCTEEHSEDNTELPALKEAYEGSFRVGAALNSRQVDGELPEATQVITRHFNSITPENLLKFSSIHPEPDLYNFDPADRYVSFGEEHGMFIVGHTLVWHQQTTEWVFENDGGEPTREELLQRMQDHITTVVGRYQGRIDGWDVVNEAVTDEGGRRETQWHQIIGEDYVEKAFQYARQADPGAELYYNDYNLWKPSKRAAAIELVRGLQDKGIRVDGIGMQSHLLLDSPSIEQIEESIIAFAELGVRVHITELDVDVLPRNQEGDADPYREGLPDSVQQQLADRYASLFGLFLKHSDKIDRVTFWGVNDGQSWLNNFPVRGRTNYPLLFDRNYNPKPALEAVLSVAGQ